MRYLVAMPSDQYGPALTDLFDRIVASGPPDCPADHPTGGQACDLESGHRGQHVAGLLAWPAVSALPRCSTSSPGGLPCLEHDGHDQGQVPVGWHTNGSRRW